MSNTRKARACVTRIAGIASLARAVLSQFESELQNAMLRGEPPLGPGAPPLERLIAFGRAYVAFLERHAPLLRSAEGSHADYLASAEAFLATLQPAAAGWARATSEKS